MVRAAKAEAGSEGSVVTFGGEDGPWGGAELSGDAETVGEDALEEEEERPSSPLRDIMLAEGTDKVWRHGYDRVYARVLAPLRSRRVRLLEIGAAGLV